jgi:hypothetical protein
MRGGTAFDDLPSPRCDGSSLARGNTVILTANDSNDSKISV